MFPGLVGVNVPIRRSKVLPWRSFLSTSSEDIYDEWPSVVANSWPLIEQIQVAIPEHRRAFTRAQAVQSASSSIDISMLTSRQHRTSSESQGQTNDPPVLLPRLANT